MVKRYHSEGLNAISVNIVTTKLELSFHFTQKQKKKGENIGTLRSLINVASQINIALYTTAKINKRSLLNKRSPLK